jgi:hypothetical protein
VDLRKRKKGKKEGRKEIKILVFAQFSGTNIHAGAFKFPK